MALNYDSPLIDNTAGSPTLDSLKSGSDKINGALTEIKEEVNDLGSASLVDTGTAAGEVPLNSSLVPKSGGTFTGDIAAPKITASTGILFGTDTAAANTLDDYETGTWLPSIGGNTTYTRQIGNYTKIGKLVTLSGEIDVNVLGTGSTRNITGLPFTNSNIQGTGSINFFTDLAVSPVSLVLHIPFNDSGMITYGLTAASATMSPIDIFGDNARIIFTAIYLT